MNGRDVANINCSCGGEVHESDPSEEEEGKYGCGRSACCVSAMQCDKCGTRFVFNLEAPEMEWYQLYNRFQGDLSWECQRQIGRIVLNAMGLEKMLRKELEAVRVAAAQVEVIFAVSAERSRRTTSLVICILMTVNRAIVTPCRQVRYKQAIIFEKVTIMSNGANPFK